MKFKFLHSQNFLNKENKIKVFLFYFFFLAMLSAQAQTMKVSGVIVDDSEIGLPGVNILIKGTSVGTVSEVDGSYEIMAEKGNTLVFSFTGFANQEIVVGDDPSINVAMSVNAEMLDEIVVTGYGQTQNKRLVSTAISTIDPKVIRDRPITRLEQAIQGSAPSIVVLQESGSPGAPLTLRMRGVSTAGNATPLVMVNGVQVPDMNFINQNDIKSITILKDAASSAIYGARAGNGVILIETKNGVTDNAKPIVTLSSYYGIQSLATKGDYLTGPEYAEYYNNSVLYLIRENLPINGRTVFYGRRIK